MKYLVCLLLLSMAACSSNEEREELRAYFYPENKEDKFYVYRDQTNGLDEQIHRIYTVKDSKGKHLVIERYNAEGRITEAYNYGLDSLLLDDYMVVDRDGKKRQAELFKNELFPIRRSGEMYFASRFPGVADSTFFLYEIKRRVEEEKVSKAMYMDKERQLLLCADHVRLTVFNPFTKKENSKESKVFTVYAKDLGLVEWFDEGKNVHFVLEQVLDRKEGLKLLGRSH